MSGFCLWITIDCGMFWKNYPTNPCQLSDQKGKSLAILNMEYKTLSDCTRIRLINFYILQLGCTMADVLPWNRLLTENILVGEEKGNMKPLLLRLICCNVVNRCLFSARLFSFFFHLELFDYFFFFLLNTCIVLAFKSTVAFKKGIFQTLLSLSW